MNRAEVQHRPGHPPDLRREIRVQIMQLALVAQARCSEVS